MSEQRLAKLESESVRLRVAVSRLYGLGVASTGALMKLSLLLAEETSLPPSSRQAAVDIFKFVDEQLEILQELSQVLDDNDGR
jgi:hypothetical protein